MRNNLISIFLVIFFSAIFAQPTRFEERIVAVVGNRIITSGQVELAIMLDFGGKLPPDSAQLDEAIQTKVRQLVDEELLLLAAEKESIVVEEDRVEDVFNRQWKYMVENSGGEKGLEEGLKNEGYTLDGFRRKTRERIKDFLKKQAYVEKHFRKVNVTEPEVDSFYAQYKDSLPLTPPSVDFSIILVLLVPDSITVAKALERINEARRRIDGGEDFSKVAAELSEDTLTASRGGVFAGKFQRGTFKQKDIDSLIFSLNIGEVGGPIRSPAGFHLFKVLDKTTDGIVLAHILAKASITPEQARTRRMLADSIFSRVMLASEKFDSIGESFSSNPTVKYAASYGLVPISSLPEKMKNKVEDSQVGTILGPDETENGIAIYKIIEKNEGRELDLTTDREIIREGARQFKLRKQIDEHIARLRKQFYVEIRI